MIIQNEIRFRIIGFASIYYKYQKIKIYYKYIMLLDKYLSFNKKVYIAVLFSGLWIYFRTAQCYEMIPRREFLPVLFVMSWAYLNYYEPLFLPIGLAILVGFPIIKRGIFITSNKHSDTHKADTV